MTATFDPGQNRAPGPYVTDDDDEWCCRTCHRLAARGAAARALFGDNCGECGHAAPHPLPCPATITVATGKNQTTRSCPCKRDHTSQEKPL